MHDANGLPLKVGDHVLIPAVITALHGTDTYCNVDVESVIGRRPDGAKERITAINTGVMVRADKAPAPPMPKDNMAVSLARSPDGNETG